MVMKKEDYRWIMLITGQIILVTEHQEIQIKMKERILRIKILLGDS